MPARRPERVPTGDRAIRATAQVHASQFVIPTAYGVAQGTAHRAPELRRGARTHIRHDRCATRRPRSRATFVQPARRIQQAPAGCDRRQEGVDQPAGHARAFHARAISFVPIRDRRSRTDHLPAFTSPEARPAPARRSRPPVGTRQVVQPRPRRRLSRHSDREPGCRARSTAQEPLLALSPGFREARLVVHDATRVN